MLNFPHTSRQRKDTSAHSQHSETASNTVFTHISADSSLSVYLHIRDSAGIYCQKKLKGKLAVKDLTHDQ